MTVSKAAARYASRGWYVHPIAVGEKYPSISGWAQATGEGASATLDAAVIASRFDGHSGGVGVATGLSGLLVLDLDVKDGVDGVAEWDKLGIELPDTLTQRTGGGGLQLFFSVEESGLKNSANKLAPGVDIRADGGQCVLPPSVHPSGRRYAWIGDEDDDIAPAPEELLELVRKARAPSASKSTRGRRVAEGGRNVELASVVGRVKMRGGSEATLRAAAAEVNASFDKPLDAAEVDKVVRSILTYSDHPMDDGGAVDRLVALFGGNFHYLDGLNSWRVWDGKTWNVDAGGLRIIANIRDVVAQVRDEAAQMSAEHEAYQKLVLAYAKQLANRTAHVQKLARAAPGVAVSPGIFDKHQDHLPVANGVVDLNTGALEPPRRDHYFTRVSPVAYDLHATAPRWELFLEEVFPDPDVRDYVQRAVGYSMTGDVRESVLFFCYGAGANGKSTFLETVRRVLGPFAGVGAPGLLVEQRGEVHPTILAGLDGLRFVFCEEMDEGSARLASTRVKMLTGGATMSVRRMREDFWQMAPTFKLWASANDKPTVVDDSAGMWRRMKLIPFTQSFNGKARDTTLQTTLDAELPGILNWALVGALEWREKGLATPAEIVRLSEEYRKEEDLLVPWLDAQCIFEPGAKTGHRELLRDYLNWTNREADQPMTPRTFRVKMRGRFSPGRVGDKRERAYNGVRLRTPQDSRLALVKP